MSAGNHNLGRKKSPLFFGLLFRVVLIVAAIAMALSYAAVYVNPSEFKLPLLFGLYFIPILIINFILLIIAAIRRSASIWIPIIALLPALLFTELFFKIRVASAPQTEGIKLKIESYNVGMFSASSKKLSKQECRDKIREHLYDEYPDIVCLQEFYADTKEQADTIFSKYNYRFYHLFKTKTGKLFGNIILSKYPITNSEKISFPRSTNLCIYADIEHFGRTIRIYNNHLESYNVSFAALIQKISKSHKISSDQIKNDIVLTHEKMLGTFIKRSDQVNKIMETINSSSLPAIICGDFNDTPMSYTYHTLAKGRKDSFKELGRGFAATFIPIWPLLRIDYILFPTNFEGVNHITHKIKLSDHYPISSTLLI